MAARAIWKAVIQCGKHNVPVKLYSAIEDRNIHFRILSRKGKQPVRGAMVNPETGRVVPYDKTRRAYVAENGNHVILNPSELNAMEPEPSREIELITFLPAGQIDYRWYDRPYYLGPDGDSKAYFAFTEAMENSELQGFARWVMRGKRYRGALHVHQGYLMLMSLRPAEEVVDVEDLEAPSGKALNSKELNMARQLVDMLAAELDLTAFQDDYRDRVLKLLKAKAKGSPPLKLAKRPYKKPDEDLKQALQASIKSVRKSA